MDTYWLIFISLLFSAFFSGMEIAFVSSNKLRFELDKKTNKHVDKIINFFYKYSNQYISTMLVGNNIALVIYALNISEILQPYLHTIFNNSVIIALIQIIIATIIIIFTGELIPRTIFKNNPNLWLKIFAPLLFVLYLLLLPISIFASAISAILLKIFRVPNKQKQNLDREDLDSLITESIEFGKDDSELTNDVRIFQNALDFSAVKIRDCIVPRTEIIALSEDDSTLEDLVKQFTNTGFSKILIYRESIDNIIGYFHCSDMFKDQTNWKVHIRKIQIVPETMAANKLMDAFMQNKQSIAVVVDEFGGTSGIVTLEDIMEEIFGEIEDEHDSKAYTAKQIANNEYILEGRLEIDYINELFDLDIPESENYITLAGYILYHYQNFPKLNETIIIDKYNFKVLEARNNRINMIRLSIDKHS